MNHQGGPVQNVATPSSGTLSGDDITKKLNTAIYDYLLRNAHYDVARLLQKELPILTKPEVKQSPGQRNGQQTNGVDDTMDLDGRNAAMLQRPEDLPMPQNVYDGPFLEDWWAMYWEIHFAKRNKGSNPQTSQYVAQQRNIQKARVGMMTSMDPSSMQNMRQYNGMVQGMNNGMAGMPNDLKRTAMQNRGNLTPQQTAQLKNAQIQQQMQGMQMERQGSQMDMNGPRSGSPGSGEAPSPKRQRLEGGNMPMGQGRPGQPGQMQGNQVGPSLDSPSDPAIAHTHELLRSHGLNPVEYAAAIPHLSTQPTNVQVQNMELYAQSIKLHAQDAITKTQSNMNKGMPPNMGPGGAQGSPMSQPGLDTSTAEFYATAQARLPMHTGVAQAAAGQTNGGNHALQDYQMQLMLLEQQNKKRLLMARQEQDSMTHPGVAPNGQFPPGASPQGNQRGNPSPNPNDMQRGVMDPNQVPPNMRAQMMPNGQMMRPPSSHPQMGQMAASQQQMEMIRQSQMMANGSFPPGQQPPPNGMMPGQQGPGGQPGQQPLGTPRQQNTNMPPPPAPPANSGGTNPSSPSQQSAAPPTPSQTNKAKPGAKGEAKKKGAANKKGAAPNATPASESEQPPTPTPATPITPMNATSFGKGQQLPNGQAAAAQQANAQAHNANQQQQQMNANAVQPPSGGAPDMGAPFGSLDGSQFPDNMNLDFTLDNGDVLDNFDFDSFLNQDGDPAFTFDANLAFGDGLDAGIENTN